MQDIHSIGSGGGGRLFGGGGDRRLRPHQNHAHLQALKCPRCDSLNTKFCYYNNYNLSQPRHFCKSCRRYWTKGGVLRNVPVGGGCRKTKRSKPKAASSEAPPPPRERKNKSSNSQNSSSDSSSLTANTTSATATTATAAAEVLSGSSSNSAPTLLSFAEHQSTRSLFSIMNPQSTSSIRNPSLQDPASAEENGMFPEIGTLTSLMSDPVGFNIGDISCFRLQQQSNEQVQAAVVEDPRLNNHQQWMGPEQVSGAGFVDQAAEMEYSALQGGAVEWPGGSGGGDQGLFDLTGSVDQSYWNQAQWSDQDHQVLNYQLP